MAKANIMITKVLTGHMYLNSPYETYDSCGNCDGAKCERCRERYEVEEYDELGLLQFGWRCVDTLDEAKALKNELEQKALAM